MLRTVRNLEGLKVAGVDGGAGTIRDIYFDDRDWSVRYLIADTGSWLLGIQVLISPRVVTQVDETLRHISVDLTRQQIERSPLLDSHVPVYGQVRQAFTGDVGGALYLGFPHNAPSTAPPNYSSFDPQLRSARHITGFQTYGSDGHLGHVADLVVDDETWEIAYLVIDTGHWRPGKRDLVDVAAVERISLDTSRVFLDIDRMELEQLPDVRHMDISAADKTDLERVVAVGHHATEESERETRDRAS